MTVPRPSKAPSVSVPPVAAGAAATEDPASAEPPGGATDEELKALAESIAQTQAERDRLRDQLVRTSADFDNFRKRARRDVEEALRRGKEDTLREILPVIDNLERAVAATASATDAKSVAAGVNMVLRQFEEIAGRLQLHRVKVVGEKFDPMLHEAVQAVPNAELPPGTVTMEVVAGYRMGDKLLRPAVVVVSAPPPAPPAEASPAASEPKASMQPPKVSVPPKNSVAPAAGSPTEDKPADDAATKADGPEGTPSEEGAKA